MYLLFPLDFNELCMFFWQPQKLCAAIWREMPLLLLDDFLSEPIRGPGIYSEDQ